MDIVQASLESLNWKAMIGTGMRILLVLVFAWIVAGVAKRVLSHMEKRLMSKAQVEGEPPSESAKRIETLTRLIRQGVYLVLAILVVLVILKELGVDIAPILAGAGIGFMARWEAERQPNLVAVMEPLPEWAGPLWLVTHVDLHRTTKVQTFLKHLKARAADWT